MVLLHKSPFLAACVLALTACGSEHEASTPAERMEIAQVESVEESPPPRTVGPNYCHGREYNPAKPFRFVYFNLPTHKNEMKRIRNVIDSDLEAIKELPAEAKAEAFKGHFAKTQALAALSIQALADQILPVSATLCNFDIYSQNKCTGALSRSVSGVEMTGDALAYSAPDARGQDSRVVFSNRDYSDITIEARGGMSHWSRTKDGTESFSFVDPNTETRWTENPDCSGTLTKVIKKTSIEATWTSPKTGALEISYNYCNKGECFEGVL